MLDHPKVNWKKVGRIVEMRGRKMTYRKIGQELGISFQRVYQLMNWYGQEYVSRKMRDEAESSKRTGL